MNLAIRQLYAVTTAYSRAPEFIENTSPEILRGLLDTIEDLAAKAYQHENRENPVQAS